jgi:hypothetical protein
MKNLSDSRLWDEIIRDAVKHRTLHQMYFEAGYREGVRDTERQERKAIAGEGRND